MTPNKVAQKIGEQVKIPATRDRNYQCHAGLTDHGCKVSIPIHDLFRGFVRIQLGNYLRQER